MHQVLCRDPEPCVPDLTRELVVVRYVLEAGRDLLFVPGPDLESVHLNSSGTNATNPHVVAGDAVHQVLRRDPQPCVPRPPLPHTPGPSSSL